jgi:hypothetical protein
VFFYKYLFYNYLLENDQSRDTPNQLALAARNAQIRSTIIGLREVTPVTDVLPDNL